MIEAFSFYFFGVLIIASFLVAVASANVLYAMSALASGMIFISGIFFTLGAEFLGVVQIAVYAGAVMALYAFGMMFFDSASEVGEELNHKHTKLIAFLSVGISLMIVIIFSLPRISISLRDEFPQIVESSGNVEQIGALLFTKYLILFEVIAVMLLAAMIAGIALSSKKIQANDNKGENI